MPKAARATSPGWMFYTAIWIAMMAVHQDFWNWRDATLLLGLVPVGLAYHVGYSVLAMLVMVFLVRRAWPRQLEELERGDAGAPGDGR
jgi:hypothetical protein